MQVLGLGAPVGKCRCFSEPDECPGIGSSQLRLCRQHVGGELVGGHPLPHRREAGTEGGDREIVGPLHERQLRGGLDHPAPHGHRIGRHEPGGGRAGADPVEDEIPDLSLDADPTGRGAAVAEEATHKPIRALVFLPGPYFHRQMEALPRPRLFECGADARHLPSRGDHHQEGALREAPAHSGEIGQRGAGLQQQRIDPMLGHESPGVLEPGEPLVIGDLRHALRHRGQCSNRGREQAGIRGRHRRLRQQGRAPRHRRAKRTAAQQADEGAAAGAWIGHQRCSSSRWRTPGHSAARIEK